MKAKTLTIMTIAMMMAVPANARENAKKTNAAARLTRGYIINYKTVESPIKNTVCIEYHIDENGDGKADVIRQRISQRNEMLPQMRSPFTKMEINEVYDNKYKMWKITTERPIGTHKPATAPVYTPEKTR